MGGGLGKKQCWGGYLVNNIFVMDRFSVFIQCLPDLESDVSRSKEIVPSALGYDISLKCFAGKVRSESFILLVSVHGSLPRLMKLFKHRKKEII